MQTDISRDARHRSKVAIFRSFASRRREESERVTGSSDIADLISEYVRRLTTYGDIRRPRGNEIPSFSTSAACCERAYRESRPIKIRRVKLAIRRPSDRRSDIAPRRCPYLRSYPGLTSVFIRVHDPTMRDEGRSGTRTRRISLSEARKKRAKVQVRMGGGCVKLTARLPVGTSNFVRCSCGSFRVVLPSRR